MPPPPSTDPSLRAENAELRARLEDAEEMLRAIRAGEVDALVVAGDDAGPQLFTQQGLDAEQSRFRDITDRKDVDAALRLMNERLTLAVKCSQVVLFQQDLDLRYIWHLNPELGLKVSDFVGKRDADLMERAEDAAMTEGLKREVIRTGVGQRQEVLVHMPGADRHYDLLVEPQRDAAGLISGVTCAAIDITDRKETEAALRLMNERLTLAVKCSEVVLFQQDLELRYTWLLNSAPGWDDSYCIGKRNADLVDLAEDAAVFDALKREVIRTGVGQRAEIAAQVKGAVRHFDLTVEPLRDAAGLVSGVTCASIEITERKRAEEARHEMERNYQALADASLEVPYRMSADWATMLPLDGRELFVSSDRPVADWEWMDHYLPRDEHARVRQMVSEAIAGKKLFEMEHRVLRLDGATGWVRSRAVPILDENEEVTAWFGAASDITERKQAEERLRLAIDGSDLGTWHWDILTGELDWSERCLKIFGLPPRTAMSYEKFLRALHPEDRARAEDAVERTLQDGSEYRIEFRSVWPDGSVHWAVSIGRAYYDDAGEPTRMEGIALDITARKQTEEAQRLLASIVENSRDFIGIADTDGKPVYGNRAAMELVGLQDLEQVRRSKIIDYFIPEQRPFLEEVVLPAVATDGRWSGELTMQHFVTGAKIPVLYELFRVDDPVTGQLVNVATITRDLTETKRAEEQVLQHRQLQETVVNHLPAAVALIRGSDLTFQMVNPGYQAISPGKQMVGKTISEVWPETHPLFGQRCRHVLETGEPFNAVDERHEIRRGSDGPLETAYFSWSMRRVNLPNEVQPGLLLTVWETTARKEVELALSEKSERHTVLLDSIDQGFCVIEVLFKENRPKDYLFLEINPAFEKHTGMKEAQGKWMREMVPDHDEHWFEIYGKIALTGEPARFEQHGRALGRWFDVFAFRVGDPEEHRVAILFTDITERRQTEEALREKAHFLQRIAEITPGVLHVYDLAERRAVFINRSVDSLLGYSPEEVLAMGAEATPSLMHPEDFPRFIEYKARVGALADGEVAQFEFRMRDRAGAWHWFLNHDSVFSRDATGAARQTIGVASEITERKHAEEALRESEERIQQALRVSQSFTFDWNSETDLVHRSASAGAILHLARGEAVSETVRGYFRRIHPEDRERCIALVASLRPDARDYTVDYRVVRADGVVVSLEEVGRGSFDAAGKLVRLEGVATDVTRRRQAEAVLLNEITERQQAEAQVRQLNAELEQRVVARTKELEEKAAELELTLRYKSEFLANMSHELRTPLNSLLILSGALADNKSGNLSGLQTEWAKIIQGSGTDLLRLINEVLDLAKIEAGKVEIEVADTSLASVLDFNERTFSHVAKGQKLSFTLSLDPSLPASLCTDAYRLQQILKNLVANAFKFTPAGEVALSIAPATHGWGPDHERLNRAPRVIAFAVRDTGIGIASDKQRMIFDAFMQAESGTARKYGGTGLGLAISRDLARLLGGTIRVESQPGAGSTFTLYLPDDSPPARLPAENALFLPRSAADEQADASNEILHGGKVLIVDDDARNIYALTSLLENHKMQVLTATGGRAAIEIIKKTPGLGLVLMDIMMPEMDGYETLREIRRAPEFRTLPILALTAKALKGDREKCLDAGASDYITKPVDLNQLLSMMRKCLSR